MGERFNSGNGGYTCDQCGVLIWSGYSGKSVPENRYYEYGTKKEAIVENEEVCFCSQKCYEDSINK
jgi:hypothetical protein